MKTDKIINLITKINNYKTEEIEKTHFFLSSIKTITGKIKNKREEYKFDRELNFNIFTSVSDTYYRENFHSYILTDILNPYTEGIGNKKYLDLFIEILNKKNNKIKIPKFKNDIVVVREKERIDILIHDNKNAIIIENKINNAPDQPNQLGRYFKTVKQDVAAIVYLILAPGKKPDLNYKNDKDYSKKDYYKNIAEIKEKLIILSVIDNKNEIDLTHDFLDKCNEITETENILAKVFIEQYSILLKHLGGKQIIMKYQQELLQKICLKKENIDIVKELVEIWKERDTLSTKIFINSIHDQLSKRNYVIHNGMIKKEINKKEKLFLVFSHDNYNNNEKQYYFGFAKDDGKLSTNDKKILEDIFDNKIIDDSFLQKTKTDEIIVWRYLDVIDSEIIVSKIKYYTKYAVSTLKELEKLYNEKFDR
jgi:PD-(D/E)XK nuclease superfamily protein